MEFECYLVEVEGRYFICEDRPEVKVRGKWQTDGMHVQIPYHTAVFLAQRHQQDLEENCVIDLADTDFLFD